jgi:hypothetical protein
MILASYEVPVAHSMVALARRPSTFAFRAFQDFICYWTAFNNIYVTVAEQRGRRARLRYLDDGTIRTRLVANVRIPEVMPISERQQLDLVLGEFGDDLKHGLIEHTSTRFFAYRTPRWRGHRIESNASGQRLNGVINVGYTVNTDYPVWSPIDTEQYESYMQGDKDIETRNALAKQILDLLYTVRNNALHGGKRADDANDHEVVERALPLLASVVEAFLHPHL